MGKRSPRNRLKSWIAVAARGAGARSVTWAWLALLVLDLLNTLSHWGVHGRRPWVGLGPLPVPAQDLVLILCAAGLFVVLIRPPRGPRLRRAAAWAFAATALAALLKAGGFYLAVARGVVGGAFPVPFALVVAALALAQARRMLRGQALAKSRWRAVVYEGSGAVCWLLALVLGHVLLFGTASREQRADAVVVFGARAYADGRPSLALHDRVRTACRLYRDGLARTVVLSGGPGDGAQSEPDVMARLARGWGVPESGMVLDQAGVNTRATILNARRLARERGWRTVLMVSHYYHLSRIDLCCCRAGLQATTVPARQTRRLALGPYFIAREVAAWLHYNLSSIFRPARIPSFDFGRGEG